MNYLLAYDVLYEGCSIEYFDSLDQVKAFIKDNANNPHFYPELEYDDFEVYEVKPVSVRSLMDSP